MKATFKFNLPEEQQEYDIFKQGYIYHTVLWEFGQYLRNREKHSSLSDEAYKELDIITDEFWKIMNNNNADFE